MAGLIFSVSKKSILTFLLTLQNRRKVLFYRLFCDNILYSRRAKVNCPERAREVTLGCCPLELPCDSVFGRRSTVF